MNRRPGLALAAISVIAVATLSGCGGGDSNEAFAGCGSTQDELVSAAKKEGTVVWYTGVPAEAAQEAAVAFNDKYGFTPAVLKLPSTSLLQRYSSEAQSGKIAADVVVTPGAERFAQGEGLAKGWTEPIKDAGIPAIDDGSFPKNFVFEGAATVSIQPWLIAVNTDKIDSGDMPTGWEDLADSKYKGKLLMPNPSASDAYVELWTLLDAKYGPELLSGIKANEPKVFDSGGSTNQALGAGEGGINVSTTGSSAAGVIDAGAPVKAVQPAFTTGAEMQLMVTNEKKAAHPCAGKLLAGFLASEEGAKVQSENGDAVSAYDTPSLPAEYQVPPVDALDKRDDVLGLLGVDK